jgi:hypothetical protein
MSLKKPGERNIKVCDPSVGTPHQILAVGSDQKLSHLIVSSKFRIVFKMQKLIEVKAKIFFSLKCSHQPS